MKRAIILAIPVVQLGGMVVLLVKTKMLVLLITTMTVMDYARATQDFTIAGILT